MKLSNIDTKELNKELIKKIFFNIKKEKYNNADYIIIYGCHIKELLDERLNYALEIIKNHDYKKIVLTGGVGVNGDFNESKYMEEFLINNGISPDKIIIENKSTTTEENNINILNIIDFYNIDKITNVVLVTHEFHILRLKLHWDKLLTNKNIRFFYDFCDSNLLSYQNIINNNELYNLMLKQFSKTKEFIGSGIYSDIEIN